jgi:hypothetical protein
LPNNQVTKFFAWDSISAIAETSPYLLKELIELIDLTPDSLNESGVVDTVGFKARGNLTRKTP